jgi:type IV pilus assembly protein PilV
MGVIVMLNKKCGFTLIELLVAMVILAIALLGLLNGYIFIKNTNTANLLRDESTLIAQEIFEKFRSITNTEITNEAAYDSSKTCDPNDTSTNSHRVVRQIRNVQYPFGVIYKVDPLVDQVLPVKLIICWEYKGKLKTRVFETLMKGN